jgi:hypothetical protein
MMAFVFAVAPVLSMGLATPAGAFSTVVVHSHAGGDEDHSHHSHDHDHDHSGSATHHGPAPLSDGGPHHGKGTAHVHQDASCPSVLMPTPIADLAEPRPDKVFDRPLLHSLSGASPDTLLRPPISHLHI